MSRPLILAAVALAFAGVGFAGVAWAAPPATAAFTGGKFGFVALYDAKACPKPAKGKTCPVIVNGHQFYGLSHTYSLRLADGTVLTAPAGMQTDLASVPRLFWPWLPPDGPYGKAAGIHDDCYRTQGTFVWRWPGHPDARPFIGMAHHPPLKRGQCDDALLQGMIALQVPAWQRTLVYQAVRLFGGGAFGS